MQQHQPHKQLQQVCFFKVKQPKCMLLAVSYARLMPCISLVRQLARHTQPKQRQAALEHPSHLQAVLRVCHTLSSKLCCCRGLTGS